MFSGVLTTFSSEKNQFVDFFARNGRGGGKVFGVMNKEKSTRLIKNNSTTWQR
jgi:hypothetical protein